jgi:hypothetical protein
LVSGCLENVGLCPLIIFTGKESAPEHAFAGCWVGSTPGPRPVVDRDTLIRESDRGNLLVLECTGVAEGVPWEKGRLSFQEAEKSAEEQLHSAAWACAVDVGALRPPRGTITPMDSALQPEVAKAYEAAKGFARSKRGRTIGTLHLLYGILSSEGELIRELLAELGLQAERVREELDRAIQQGTGTGAPVETRNVTQIRSIAEGEARRSGSSSVREAELLWAFLERCEDSKSFPEICDRIGFDVARLRRSLARKCPRQVPLMESSVFVVPSKQQTIL